MWHPEAACYADRVKTSKARRFHNLDSTEAPSAARQRAARSFDSTFGTPGQSRTHHSFCGVLCSTTRVNLPVPVRCTFVNAVLLFCQSSSLLRSLGSSWPTACSRMSPKRVCVRRRGGIQVDHTPLFHSLFFCNTCY